MGGLLISSSCQIGKCAPFLRQCKPAKFVKKMNNLNVEKGKPLILECTYSGTPPIAVLWKKNGYKVVHSAKCSITTTETSAILEVPSSKIEDQGQYTCHIENDSGRDLCQADISVTVGDSASLQCQVAGTPEIVLLPLSFNAVLSFNRSFPFYFFKCGFVAFFYADRIVPPFFTRKLKETCGVLGSSALLECKVSGSPPISVAWFQDGNEIVSGDKYEVSFSDNVCGLKLNALDSSDTGPYTCVATNAAGSDECSAFLIVQGHVEDSGDYTCEARNAAGIANTSTSLKVKGQNSSPFFC
uniref:Ig-like domain-containing protein n=1 Tax=Chelonoidis abingdonii TaxID=106734 RepID=A0A8C0IT93_CHEAB